MHTMDAKVFEKELHNARASGETTSTCGGTYCSNIAVLDDNGALRKVWKVEKNWYTGLITIYLEDSVI